MSTKKLNTHEFIKRAKVLHGDKFDYSAVSYVNSSTKVLVTCNTCKHTWHVSPANHIGPAKSGCPECKRQNHIARNSLRQPTTAEFIARVSAILPNYNYSEVEYNGTGYKVTVICQQHGRFEKWPSDLYNGSGCPHCSGNAKKTTEQFVIEANQRFPEFDYSLVDYVNAHTPVTIVCPRHGKFKHKPNAILNNIGCSKCAVSRMLKTKIAKGAIRDPDSIPEYAQYRREVWKYSNRAYKEHCDIINPNKLLRGHKYHLDHKYSISQGFINNVPAEVIGSYHNLQVIASSENRKKSHTCAITLTELLLLHRDEYSSPM